MECHAFLCRKRKIAQAASLTVAQAFNLAFTSWKDNQEKKDSDKEKNVSNPSSIKLSLETCPNNVADENLLIDLRSPGDPLEDKTFPPTVLINIDADHDHQDNQDMDRRFALLSDNPSPALILR